MAGGLLWGVLSKQKNGERRFREQELKIIEKLRYQLEKYENLAAELKITPANLALAWLRYQPDVTAPIIGPRTETQLDNAIEGLSITLSDKIIYTLNDIWPGMGGEAPEAYAW